MTPAERSNLEYVYDRLYRLYESGDIRPGEMQELQRLDGLLRPMWDAEQAQYEYETQPRIMAREPTVVESLTDWMTPGIESVTGLSPRSSAEFARDVAGLLDFTPVIGGGISMAQAVRDARRGDYGAAAVNAGLGLLDLLPLKIPKAKTKTLAEGMIDVADHPKARDKAFDTALPEIYGRGGFRPVSRLPFAEDIARGGWGDDATDAFMTANAKHSGGRPDLVFMVRNPADTSAVKQGRGGLLTDDYDLAVQELDREMKRLGYR